MHSDSRTSRVLRVLAIVAFVALLLFGPLTENTLLDKLFALTLVLCVTLALLLASARPTFAMLLSALLFGTLEISGRLKFAYLATPLLAPDLEYFINGDTVDVIRRYPQLLAISLLVLVLLTVLPALAFVVDCPRLFAERSRYARAALRSFGTLATLAVAIACISPSGPFAGVFGKPMWLAITDKSYLTNFFTSFDDTVVTKPAITSDVDRKIGWSVQRKSPVLKRSPDVVAILEESTFDPRIMELCTLPVCRRPMFDPDQRTRANGLLTVHTFGGGTWTSEFALLTGLAHDLFGNAGLYAPYNLAPRVEFSLPRAFKAAGYRAIAIYPMSGEFLNARNAYRHYGFDAFYDGTDYGLDWESHDADLLAVFRRIYAEEKKSHGDQPLFVFMLTLHQHGPHMRALVELPAPYDKPLFPGSFKPQKLDDWLNLNLSNYLQRLQESDEMLTALEGQLWSADRPAVLLHFGDHQPSFDGAIHVIAKKVPKEVGPNSNKVTYYMLKSNFPLRTQFDYPVIDIAFLGSLLLETAGIPENAFYQANSLLRERCKGRYFDCPDKKLLMSYHDLVFNHLDDLRDE
ncbi:MAG: LTA synthase family protein [Dokdonella sp.]